LVIKRALYLFAAMFCAAMILLSSQLAVIAQEGQQPTPLSLDIPTMTATNISLLTTTPTRTPTTGASLLRVEATDANVRAAPNLEAEIYGKITPGNSFAVMGRYVDWYQIQYPNSPSGLGWVFSGVVTITGGDPATLPEISLDAEVTTGAPLVIGDGTLTPSGNTPLPDMVTASSLGAVGGVLPTFTYPPPFIESTVSFSSGAVQTGGVPPIVPIVGLLIIGLTGVLISGLRRG
jgi:hypothetical protein